MNEIWLILCQEYINSKLFAVCIDLWEAMLSSCGGPVTKCLLQIQRVKVRIQGIFFHDDILGSLGSNLVFIIPFGI